MTMVESITHHWGIEGNDIIDLHEVLEPSIPLRVPGEWVFVMEMRGDGQHRLLEDDKLILAEVRIASASLRTSKMNRIVLWSRLLMQRPQAFVLLRMDEFCARRGTRECILLHNNRVWTKDDRSSHRMENGDFLMIEAFVDDLSLTEAWNELKRYEEHECNRRLFTTSSEAQIGGEQNAACSQEGEALGSEQDSPRDFSPSGEAANAEDEDFSLVCLRSTERTFSDFSDQGTTLFFVHFQFQLLPFLGLFQ